MLDQETTEGLLVMMCDWQGGTRHPGECHPDSAGAPQPNCTYFVFERGCDRLHALLHYLSSRRVGTCEPLV